MTHYIQRNKDKSDGRFHITNNARQRTIKHLYVLKGGEMSFYIQ